jgi:hypothetical protein
MCLPDRVRLVTGAASDVGRPVPLRAGPRPHLWPTADCRSPRLRTMGRIQKAAAPIAQLAFNESRLARGSAHVIDGGPYRLPRLIVPKNSRVSDDATP